MGFRIERRKAWFHEEHSSHTPMVNAFAWPSPEAPTQKKTSKVELSAAEGKKRL